MKLNQYTRRSFLKITAGGILTAAVLPNLQIKHLPYQFPKSDKLGRICAGGEGARFDIKSKPDINSSVVGTVYRDDVIPWHREVVATNWDYTLPNQRWVETDNGYVYSSYVQPVRDDKNQPITSLPTYGDIKGMWVEITVPLSDLTIVQPASSFWLRSSLKPRVYYGQVLWADDISQTADGKLMYRLTQRFGSAPDYYWTPAEACKVIQPEDITPINPDATDKKVVVNLNRQTLSCMEGNDEVYYCRVSTGPKLSDGWATEPGDHPVWRRLVSLHMSAGGGAGEAFDTPGIAWVSIFTSQGAAIHAAYWHNDFGLARSHGCVNVVPSDAKWIWRWMLPPVDYGKGDIVLKWNSDTPITHVNVIEE